MKKNLRIILMVSIFVLLIPLCVKAEEYGLTVSCKKQNGADCPISNDAFQIPASGKVNLIFTVTGGEMQSFSSRVSLSDNLTGPTDFSANYDYFADMASTTGNSGYENGTIGLMTKNNPSGNAQFNFYVTADSTTGDATVTLSDIEVLTGQSLDLEQKVVALKIVPASEEDTTNNSTVDNNTIDNSSNTNTGDTESSKSDSKKGNAVSNPKTGVKVSVASLIILAVGAGAYVVLRKKNYFNKI